MYKLVGCFNLHLIVLAQLYGKVLYIQAGRFNLNLIVRTCPVIWNSTVQAGRLYFSGR